MTGGPPDTALWAACARLLTEAGVRSLHLEWHATAGPGWSASALDTVGNRVTAAGLGPAMAFAALAERVASGRRCGCGRPIVLSDRALYANGGGCRWQLVGARFVPLHNGHQPKGPR